MGMKYCAAYLMAVLVGKESPTAEDIKKILGSIGSDCDDAIVEKLVTELHGKSAHEVIEAGREKLQGFGGGGGGFGGAATAAAAGVGAGAAAAAAGKDEKKAVVEEEEEEDMDFDLFS